MGFFYYLLEIDSVIQCKKNKSGDEHNFRSSNIKSSDIN